MSYDITIFTLLTIFCTPTVLGSLKDANTANSVNMAIQLIFHFANSFDNVDNSFPDGFPSLEFESWSNFIPDGW